ncbi:MAG: GAF domain-containing protein [bacterium]|nr:GAF domain-containing protein [bacterium]
MDWNPGTLIGEVQRIVRGPGADTEKLQRVCDLLAERVPHYDWVGFYLVNPDNDRELVLGPYTGAATEQTRIPFGRGVCGRAADERRTVVVGDVTREDNYLACSAATKAEIVTPVFHSGVMVGQIDIDSHTTDPFTPRDRELLDAIRPLVAPLLHP